MLAAGHNNLGIPFASELECFKDFKNFALLASSLHSTPMLWYSSIIEKTNLAHVKQTARLYKREKSRHLSESGKEQIEEEVTSDKYIMPTLLSSGVVIAVSSQSSFMYIRLSELVLFFCSSSVPCARPLSCGLRSLRLSSNLLRALR